ncbi:3'-5' exonuclease [Pontibacillus marinus]|uniref:DNA polymerase III subunit epsilon n=1 Tax=Pontibacillus marinus BH030004 = DSM 16465 TaxID=1385511 RepID=A0A0A5GBC1_9BACI|nr:3'-5' exonuclease [Pontibacillus marinus]KGX90466.1 DNA polymerase III subunit epsilon [Pontibacillus marinus BH030004 = DSM 16465]
MLPIDIEILKYIFYERHVVSLKMRPYFETCAYQALEQQLKSLSLSDELLSESVTEAPYTIFDLETTGLLPELGHEIISIGAIRIQGVHQIQYERFHMHVKPLRRVTKRTRQLTGITEEELEQSDSILEALGAFLEFSKGSILVAYPAAFDMKFLRTMLKRWKLPDRLPPSIDAQTIAKKLYPNRKHQLDTMIPFFGITKLARHHALNDATMTAELYQQLLHQLPKDVHTVQDLISFTEK